ncbi:MAG: ABC transporter permease [candidate division WOR-3 bacterium]
MRFLGTLVWKEMRELLTVRMLVPFVAVLVLFLFIGRMLRGERKRAEAPQPVLVVSADSGPVSDLIVRLLGQSGLTAHRFSGPLDSALIQKSGNWVALVRVPESADVRLERFEPVGLEVYTPLRGLSFGQTMRGAKVKTALARLDSVLARQQIERLAGGLEPEAVQHPLRKQEYVVLKGRVAPGSPEQAQGLLLGQTFLVPIILLLVIIYASQMIAASIGQEKENKTLETLLTVPVSRVLIVAGKMLGAAIAAVVISAVFMLAMGYYTTGFAEGRTEVPSAGISGLGLSLTTEGVVVLGITLFLAIMAALALATLLAVFSEDAKSAQANITPLMMLCLIPYFFVLMFDISTLSLPLRLLVLAIPFSYPFLVPQALIFGNYRLIIFGIVYTGLFAVILVLLAAWFFQGERVLTARLRLRRR